MCCSTTFLSPSVSPVKMFINKSVGSGGSGISKSMKDNRPHPFQRVQLSIRFKLYVHLTDQNYSVICKYGNNCQDRLSISVRGGLV